MSIPVNVDTFAHVETDTMISRILSLTGGLGVFHHDRELAPLEQQPVIRQNRDTLYSVAVVDLADGAELVVPDAGDRYLSVMVINQYHYINRVYHHLGTNPLKVADHGSAYVVVAARILFDPTDPADLDDVHRLQDGLEVRAGTQRPFVRPDYDVESHTEVRGALLTLARTLGEFTHAFGRADQVDPVHHLVATAAGWGGLPDDEAAYVGIDPGLPVGRYRLRLADVPADAFWSVSVYGADGYFVPNGLGVNNVNSVFAVPDDDGAVTVHLGDWGADVPNRIPLHEGWNLLVRLYRPRREDLATWEVPAVEPADGRPGSDHPSRMRRGTAGWPTVEPDWRWGL
jgi:hypothetical protein